jgi:hypothetical protein
MMHNDYSVIAGVRDAVVIIGVVFMVFAMTSVAASLEQIARHPTETGPRGVDCETYKGGWRCIDASADYWMENMGK